MTSHPHSYLSPLQPEIVLQKDSRQYVTDTSSRPYRWICSLQVLFPEPVLYPLSPLESPVNDWREVQPTHIGCGTGLMISPRHVLTSAHVISGLRIDKDQFGRPWFRLVTARRIRILSGRDERKTNNWPYGLLESRQVSINPGFRAILETRPAVLGVRALRRALAQDYGLIMLPADSRRRGERPGWWGEESSFQIRPVTGRFRKWLARQKVFLAGYPGDKTERPCGIPYQSAGKVANAFHHQNGQLQDLLLYRADTSVGMSGSPVWVRNADGGYRLVGVHSSYIDHRDPASGKMTLSNAGAMITQNAYQWLKRQTTGNIR